MNNKSSESITLCAVGDVCINRKNPKSIFDFTMPTINKADISFCQLETSFSDRGSPLPQNRLHFRASPDAASALRYAGFDVVSFASNHCMDYGSDAFLDTINTLKENGMLPLGAGKNIDEARKPVIIKRKGISIGFLAYNSILPVGYWADGDKPGCCPLRIYTLYEQIEPEQPGTRCRIRTFPMAEDFEAMKQDIRKLRAEVDILIVSFHWGLHFTHADLAEYELEVGHAAIDCGTDLVLGHHAHILKAIEVYKGNVIFHSLGNFAFDYSRRATTPEEEARRLSFNPTWKYDPEYAGYTFPVDSRQTVVAKCLISDKRISRVSFLPAHINGRAQPEILSRDDKRFDELVNYLKEITIQHGFDTKYAVDGEEVIVWP